MRRHPVPLNHTPYRNRENEHVIMRTILYNNALEYWK